MDCHPGSLFELGKRSPGPKFKPTSSAKIAHAVFTPCPAEKTVSRKRRQRAGFAPICANRSSLTPKCPFRANVVASSKFAASWSCLCVKSFRAQALCAFPNMKTAGRLCCESLLLDRHNEQMLQYNPTLTCQWAAVDLWTDV